MRHIGMILMEDSSCKLGTVSHRVFSTCTHTCMHACMQWCLHLLQLRDTVRGLNALVKERDQDLFKPVQVCGVVGTVIV